MKMMEMVMKVQCLYWADARLQKGLWVDERLNNESAISCQLTRHLWGGESASQIDPSPNTLTAVVPSLLA